LYIFVDKKDIPDLRKAIFNKLELLSWTGKICMEIPFLGRTHHEDLPVDAPFVNVLLSNIIWRPY
jgi:hypothetical protein